MISAGANVPTWASSTTVARALDGARPDEIVIVQRRTSGKSILVVPVDKLTDRMRGLIAQASPLASRLCGGSRVEHRWLLLVDDVDGDVQLIDALGVSGALGLA